MKTAKGWLAVLLGLHLLLGLVYDWATPIFEAPDEGYHVAVARWISLGQGLPVQRPGVKADWEQEGSQPPLYHMLVAGLTFWVNTSDWAQAFVHNPFTRHVPGALQNVTMYRHTAAEAFPYQGTALAVHLGRWFSLALSLLTVYLTYHLALAVFPGQMWLGLLAAALVALNPKVIFINASVNNDNLLMLLSTAALLVMAGAAQPQETWRTRRVALGLRLAGLGLLLGLAALTKVSGLVLWPMAALAVGLGAWRARDWRPLVWGGLLMAGLAVAVSGWWFWRNQALYGEWLGLQTMVAIAGPRVPPLALADLIRQEWYGFYRSYWGIFGTFTLLTPDWVNAMFDALTLLALAGGSVALARHRGAGRAEPLGLALFCLLTLAGVINWTMQTMASQGRLMFGAIAPLSILMAAGLAQWGAAGLKARAGPWVLGAGVAGFAAVALLIPVAYIAPRYAPPRALAEGDLPQDLHPARVRLGERFELVGYTVDAALRHPGEVQPVTLYWRCLQPTPQDYAVAVHLLGRGVEEVGKLDTWPGGGNAPTSQWRAGAIVPDTYWLPIMPQAMAPTLLKLDVAMWDGAPENKLPMQSAEGTPVKSLALAVGRLAPAQPPAVTPAVAAGARFEYGLTLLGVTPGDRGRLTLYWQTDQPVPGDYTVFLQLLNAAGEQVAGADGPPLGGDWPTSAWAPGQAVADARQFDLPANLPPGRYTVRVGFYEPASGARVAAFQSDGAEWPDEAVLLKDVVEVR